MGLRSARKRSVTPIRIKPVTAPNTRKMKKIGTFRYKIRLLNVFSETPSSATGLIVSYLKKKRRDNHAASDVIPVRILILENPLMPL